jgi:hypothetical protein
MGLKSKVQSLRSKVRTPKGGCGADRGPTPNIQHGTPNLEAQILKVRTKRPKAKAEDMNGAERVSP